MGFPELKESEDERIRKELIDAVQGLWDTDELPQPLSVKRKNQWIAWLEKQGEQKSTKQLNADEVIDWVETNTADFWESPCNPQRIIGKFKKDFEI